MWRNLLELRIRGWGLEFRVGALLVLAIVVLALLSRALVARRGWRLTRANFTFAGCGQLEICPDNEVARIAHQAWVEMATRKASLPFDPTNDVIAEVYNSWYELFRSLRELTKSVPPESVRARGDAPVLADVLIKALNDGLRPHLTQWQARFRRWWEEEVRSDASRGQSPQEIQRRFPEYDELVSDLVRVNTGMIEFAEQLRRIAHERKRGLGIRWRKRSAA